MEPTPSDIQAGNALGLHAIYKFIKECRSHPRFSDEPVTVMQLVYDDLCNKAQPRPWVETVAKEGRKR